jgi:hypothetical protein
MNATTDSALHILPCNIHYDGPAPISSYFRTEKQENGQYKSNFRGRELTGKEICSKFVVAAPSPSSLSTSDNTKTLEAVGSGKSFILWEHDRMPDSSRIQNINDWLEISKTVSYSLTYSNFPIINIFFS